jgi:hypothetical protein
MSSPVPGAIEGASSLVLQESELSALWQMSRIVKIVVHPRLPFLDFKKGQGHNKLNNKRLNRD